MASPLNIGDAVAILTSIYKTYDAYRSTPDKLRQALRRFEDAEKECETLNGVLATSRRQEYRTWPGTAGFVADLQMARDFFRQFKPLTDEAGNVKMIAKVKKTIRVQWDWLEVEKHVANVNTHRENMNHFKQTVLIQAAYDNTELHLHTLRVHLENRQGTTQVVQGTVQDDGSSLSSEHMSVLSRASRSLRVARQMQIEPPRRHEVRLSPIIEASSSSTRTSQTDGQDDLRRKVADFVEKVELHKPGSLQVARLQDLRYIAELPERWYRSQQEQQQQHGSGPSPRHVPISTDLLSRSSILGFSYVPAQVPARSGDAISISPSWHIALDKAQYGSNVVGSPTLCASISPERALEIDDVTISDGASVDSAQTDEEEQVIEGVMIMTPFLARPMPCRLKLVQSAGSLCIQSTTIKRFYREALPALDGITSSSLLPITGSNDDGIYTPEMTPLIFNHAVLPGMSSFPKILHPSAEVSTNAFDAHRYLIDFYQHQYLQVERYPNLPKAMMGLSYAFERETDRNLLRQKIFGKQLLASVGVSTVQFATGSVPKPCGTQAASLWKNTPISPENSNASDCGDELTITIQCSMKGKPTPDCAIEFRILKIDHKNIEKVRINKGKELELKLRRLEPNKHEPLTVVASGGVMSSSSTTSNLSNISDSSHSSAEAPSLAKSQSRRTSLFSPSRKSSITSVSTTKPLASFLCYIKITEEGNGSTRAKKDFLDALETSFKA